MRPALASKALAVLFLATGLAPGQPLAQALFDLKEMDLHLHAGMEREIEMKDWIDLAVNDGRKVILVLDHLELYRKSPQEYEAWRAKGHFQARYPLGASGHQALMADFDEAARRRDVIFFKGWEVYEGELDTGLEALPLRMAEVIGFHISPNHGREAPNGRALIRRVQQIKDAQKQFPVPMILFHPFTMRLENLQRTAANKGRDPKTLTVQEYRFFQPGEQTELAGLVKNTSIYIEISRSTQGYFADPVCREALIADIKPLADAGVQFTVSTDNHSVASAKKPFTPSLYAEALGVTPLNTNTIVRELLALRARRSLSSATLFNSPPNADEYLGEVQRWKTASRCWPDSIAWFAIWSAARLPGTASAPGRLTFSWTWTPASFSPRASGRSSASTRRPSSAT